MDLPIGQAGLQPNPWPPMLIRPAIHVYRKPRRPATEYRELQARCLAGFRGGRPTALCLPSRDLLRGVIETTDGN